MRRTPLILLSALLALPCSGQRLTVVIDAARGGNEYGARIDEHTYEKQITLDLANRLRSLLNARDFNVVLTRESDTAVTNEQRAAIANQNKPIACLLLHATSSGTGLHLWTSSLDPAPVGSTAVLWDEAQSPYVQRSQRLATELATAFSRSKIPVSSGHTWIRPLDNMQCPAIAIEIAPQNGDTDAGDRSYQTHIADAIANSMLFWRGHGDVVESILNPPAPPAPAAAATKPEPAKAGDPPVARRPAARPPAARPQETVTGTETGATTAAPRPAKPRPATTPALENPDR